MVKFPEDKWDALIEKLKGVTNAIRVIESHNNVTASSARLIK